MQLIQLVYYSRNHIEGDDRNLLRSLREILSVSQKNNAKDGITGYLIFDRDWFVQILEGDPEKVRSTYERLQTDPRHGQVTLVESRKATTRNFGAWSMGGTMRSLDKQEIFLAHGIGDAFDPSKMSASKLLLLASDLQDYDVAQKSMMKASA